MRLHLIPGLGRIPIAKLTPAEVQAFLNAKLESGLSPRRVQYILAVLRRALVTAERWGIASRNVAKLVDPPRLIRHQIRPLTPEQRRQLIDAAAGDRLEALYLTAPGTGLRQGEMLALRAAVTRAFQGALARAGLPHSRFHELRRAAAMFLLAQEFTLEDVKNLLGHSSITLTSNTYGTC